MRMIALIGNKGGAGKTTLCVNLASILAEQHRVVVLDADPQQSSLQWRRMTEKVTGFEVLNGSVDLESLVSSLDEDFDYCLIDCPPSAQSEQMHIALKLAQQAVLPILPSPVDIWATVHVESAVDAARQHNPGLAVSMVINQFESRTRLSQLMQRALDELALPAARTLIRRRAIYRQSFLDGRTVNQMGRKGEAATEEIHQLIKELEL